MSKPYHACSDAAKPSSPFGTLDGEAREKDTILHSPIEYKLMDSRIIALPCGPSAMTARWVLVVRNEDIIIHLP
jgi:hypothetical protein